MRSPAAAALTIDGGHWCWPFGSLGGLLAILTATKTTAPQNASQNTIMIVIQNATAADGIGVSP